MYQAKYNHDNYCELIEHAPPYWALAASGRGLADVYGCLIGGLSEAPLIGHLIAGWRPLVATVLKLALQLNLLHGSSWREVYMHVVWVAASIRAV